MPTRFCIVVKLQSELQFAGNGWVKCARNGSPMEKKENPTCANFIEMDQRGWRKAVQKGSVRASRDEIVHCLVH